MPYDMSSSSGWRNRRRAADARRDERDDEERAEVRRVRQRLYDEQSESDRLAAEAHEASVRAEECTCPCCGTGTVPVPKAAAMIEAWHNYNFHDYKPSKGVIASLAAIARGEPTPPGCPTVTATYGLVLPLPGSTRSAPVAVVEAVEPPKPSRPLKVKPSENDGAYTEDGALIEV